MSIDLQSEYQAYLEGAEEDLLNSASEDELIDPSTLEDSQIMEDDEDEFFFVQERPTERPPLTNLGSRLTTEDYDDFICHTVTPRKKESEPQRRYVEDLPQWMVPCFSGIHTFNTLQSHVFDTVFGSNINLLIGAPTGAGKTNVALFSILHAYSIFKKTNQPLSEFKCVYIAPMRSLVQEVVRNFTNRLAFLNFHVVEMTGDTFLSLDQMKTSNIVICTPEKWDVITRKDNHRNISNLVRVLIIDEIHLLHDERGAVLESVVTRVDMETTRVVALSATLPNYKDVSEFLNVPSEGCMILGSEHRPVPLTTKFVGVRTSLNRKDAMDERCGDIVETMLEMDHQTLVFVHSRTETARVARYITGRFDKEKLIAEDASEFMATHDVSITNLSECLQSGVGFHHAGMNRADRQLVEDLFAQGLLKVLVCTATLAWGVNLPAYCVCIRGTTVYVNGRYNDLSSLDVAQMLGRAGRPSFDKEGLGVVITTEPKVDAYVNLVQHQLPVRSSMLPYFVDSLNAEIVAYRIINEDSAIQWMRKTYLGQQIRGNPVFYGLKDTNSFEENCLFIIRKAVRLLRGYGMISDSGIDMLYIPTFLGKIASYYYVDVKTVVHFFKTLDPTMMEYHLFALLAQADELKQIRVKPDERSVLKELSRKLPFPVCVSLDRNGNEFKTIVLMMMYISYLSDPTGNISADLSYISQSCARLMRCLFEIAQLKGYSDVCSLCLRLSISFEQRLWDVFNPLTQLKIKPSIIKQLNRKSIDYLDLLKLNVAQLTELLSDHVAAEMLYEQLQTIPYFEINAKVRPITAVHCEVIVDFVPEFKTTSDNTVEPFWVMIVDDSGEILHNEMLLIRLSRFLKSFKRRFFVTISSPTPVVLFVRMVSDRHLGLRFDANCFFGFNPQLPKLLPSTLKETEPIKDFESSFALAEPYESLILKLREICDVDNCIVVINDVNIAKQILELGFTRTLPGIDNTESTRHVASYNELYVGVHNYELSIDSISNIILWDAHHITVDAKCEVTLLRLRILMSQLDFLPRVVLCARPFYDIKLLADMFKCPFTFYTYDSERYNIVTFTQKHATTRRKVASRMIGQFTSETRVLLLCLDKEDVDFENLPCNVQLHTFSQLDSIDNSFDVCLVLDVQYTTIENKMQMMSAYHLQKCIELAETAIFCVQHGREAEVEHMLLYGDPYATNLTDTTTLSTNILTDMYNEIISDPGSAVTWLTWSVWYHHIQMNPFIYDLTASTTKAISKFFSMNVIAAFNTMVTDALYVSDEITKVGTFISEFGVSSEAVLKMKKGITENRPRSIADVLLLCSEANSTGSDAFCIFEDQLYEASDYFDEGNGIFQISIDYLSNFDVFACYCVEMRFNTTVINSEILHNIVHMLFFVVEYSTIVLDVELAVYAIVLARSIVQGLPPNANPLQQLPYFKEEHARHAESLGIVTVTDLLDAEDEIRDECLGFLNGNNEMIEEIANYANSFPYIEVTCDVEHETLKIELSYDEDFEYAITRTEIGMLPHFFYIFVTDADTEETLSGQTAFIEDHDVFKVDVSEFKCESVKVQIFSATCLGNDYVEQISLK
ncbi:hypothetical protein PCE1_000123 [Barthelona sp. PCE]